jgi:hypothetical protein
MAIALDIDMSAPFAAAPATALNAPALSGIRNAYARITAGSFG